MVNVLFYYLRAIFVFAIFELLRLNKLVDLKV